MNRQRKTGVSIEFESLVKYFQKHGIRARLYTFLQISHECHTTSEVTMNHMCGILVLNPSTRAMSDMQAQLLGCIQIAYVKMGLLDIMSKGENAHSEHYA